MTQTSIHSYNPAEHLVDIKDRQGTIRKYYPAAWRLCELSLRYPNANFLSEIVHLDPERDFVIVKARLYLGADWEMSDKKVEALKQGKLSQLDKVETAAKARAARDFGVSTEFALEFNDSDVDEPVAPAQPAKPAHSPVKQAAKQPTARDKMNELYPRAKALGICATAAEFMEHIGQLNNVTDLSREGVTLEQLKRVEEDITALEAASHAA